MDWRLRRGPRRPGHPGLRGRHRREFARGALPDLRGPGLPRRPARRRTQPGERAARFKARGRGGRPGDPDRRGADDREVGRAGPGPWTAPGDIIMKTKTLSPDLLRRIDAYWRAANYLSVGQIYLRDNPLLKEPLKLEHVKHMLLGHWGTTPGQNFIYAHLNRVIKKY